MKRNSLRSTTRDPRSPRADARWLGRLALGRAAAARSVAFVLAAVLLVTHLAPVATGQERSFDRWDTIVDPAYRHDPDRTDVATFAVQNTAAARVQIDSALALLRAGEFERACEPLQSVINLHPTHLYQVSDYPTARYVGAAEFAKYLLGSFPPEARGDYAEFARIRSESLWRSISSDLESTKLEQFVRFFELTPEGRAALDRLGRLALERGDFESASLYFGRRLSLAEESEPESSEIAFLLAAAATLDGDDARAARLLERFGDFEVRLGGEEVLARSGLAKLRENAAKRPRTWPVMGGNAAHVAKPLFDPNALTFDSRWEADALTSDLNPWQRTRRTRESYPFHPVVGDDVIVLNDGISLRAWSFYSANPKWSYPPPAPKKSQSRSLGFEDFVLDANSRNDSEFGAIARSLQYSAVIADGMAIAPLLESSASYNSREIEFDQTRITTRIPKRSLHAVDLATGTPIWKLRRDDLPLQDFANRVSVSATPIVIGDRVYAAGYILEGAINVYVLCLDLKTGHVLWKTPLVIGQQELTMFNKSFKEFTLQMLGAAEGSLYVSTNLGLVASLDALTGAPRWMTQYESLPIRGSNHYRRTSERDRLWINDPPLVADGVVVVTPLDSEIAFAFDAATGARLWKVASDRDHPFDYCSMIGVDQGAVVFAGLDGIGFYDLHTGRFLGGQRYREARTFAGRGVVADGIVYQPLVDGLFEVRFEYKSTGVLPEARMLEWNCDEPGNLLLYRDFQVVTSSSRLTVFYDLDDLIGRVRSRVAAGIATAADHIDLGELLHLRGDPALALPEFEAVLKRSDVSAQDIRRARERAASAHRTLAEQASAVNDVATEVKHRFAESDHSVDDFAFLRTCEELIRTLETIDPARIDVVLDKIDARCPTTVFPFSGAMYGQPIPAGLFTLDRRAVYALGRRDAAAAVDSWQKMIENYREFPLSGGMAGAYGERMIADAIAKWGREVYAKYDAKAQAARAAAIESANAAAMAQVIEFYPNASAVAATRLDLAQLRLSRGESSDVFQVLGPLLTGGADEQDRMNALFLVARGARDAGDLALSRLILTRLVSTGTETRFRSEPTITLTEAATRELSSIPDGASTRTTSATIADLPALTQMRSIEIRSARAVLVPVQFDVDDAVLVYVESEVGSADAELRRIDVATGAERWRVRVAAYSSDFDPFVAFAFGDRIVFRQRDRILGIDAATGAVRFDTRLEAIPLGVVSTGGLIFALITPMQQGPSSLVALETGTGMTLWRRNLGFSCRAVRVTEDAVVAVGDGNDPTVGVFDALTGVERFTISNLALKLFEARPFPAHGVLLTTGRQQSKRYLSAFDLEDGRPLWRDLEVPYSMTLDWFIASGDSLLLPVGTSKAPVTNSARGVSEVRRLSPRKGTFETVVEGLESLRTFDVGSGLLNDRLLLIASESSSRKTRSDRLVTTDLIESKVVRTSELGALPRSLTSYSTAQTARGDLYGVIETKRTASSLERVFVFTYSASDEAIGIAEVAGAIEGAATHVAATPKHLVLLRGWMMYVFPAR